MSLTPSSYHQLTRIAPGIFVLMWSTGFIGAKYGLANAEPFTFLGMRFLLTLLVLAPIVFVFKARPPTNWRMVGHLAVVGCLVHGCYLGGVFSAIAHGVPAGVSAIIVGLQPVVTAAFALVWLRERLRWRRLLGLMLGLLGIILVIRERSFVIEDLDGMGLAFSAIAMMGISVGTIYQKRFCAGENLLSGTFVQYAAAGLLMLSLAFLFEQGLVQWTLPFVLAMTWLIFGLSIFAVLLLMYLIRVGEATQVASLFYLVPPLTVIESYWLFDERLGTTAISGMFFCVAAVYLVNKRPRDLH